MVIGEIWVDNKMRKTQSPKIIGELVANSNHFDEQNLDRTAIPEIF